MGDARAQGFAATRAGDVAAGVRRSVRDPRRIRCATCTLRACGDRRSRARTGRKEALGATSRWLDDPSHHVVAWDDAHYPRALLDIGHAPPVLFFIGRREILNRPAFAIVGSRNATPQGKANAREFAQALASAGLTIVSGLALGIDAAAHEGALTTEASTLAVVGTGPDRVYPARNRDLARRIADAGGIVSEFLPGTPPRKENFPRRNRLISGLARGVLVVEATLSSGSLITARWAGEQGREVFAIPGSIHSPFAKGCHKLIREGAKLVETAQDVLDELGFGTAAAVRRRVQRVRRPRSTPAAERHGARPGHDRHAGRAHRRACRCDYGRAGTIGARRRRRALAGGYWQRLRV